MSDAPGTKTCENATCGKTFEVGQLSKARLAARKYCCVDCRNGAARASAPVELKTCRNRACGKAYGKRRRETANEFLRRSYCSLDCSRTDNSGRGRVLPRRPAQLIEVVREPGQVWRPAGWTREPNVYGTVRQPC